MSAVEVTNMNCLKCGRAFNPNRDWQKFCCKECQQRWNRDQYRAAMVEDELIAKGNGRVNGNGRLQHEDAYREKWKANREEYAKWDEEDRQQRPRFLRQF